MCTLGDFYFHQIGVLAQKQGDHQPEGDGILFTTFSPGEGPFLVALC